MQRWRLLIYLRVTSGPDGKMNILLTLQLQTKWSNDGKHLSV